MTALRINLAYTGGHTHTHCPDTTDSGITAVFGRLIFTGEAATLSTAFTGAGKFTGSAFPRTGAVGFTGRLAVNSCTVRSIFAGTFAVIPGTGAGGVTSRLAGKLRAIGSTRALAGVDIRPFRQLRVINPIPEGDDNIAATGRAGRAKEGNGVIQTIVIKTVFAAHRDDFGYPVGTTGAAAVIPGTAISDTGKFGILRTALVEIEVRALAGIGTDFAHHFNSGANGLHLLAVDSRFQFISGGFGERGNNDTLNSRINVGGTDGAPTTTGILGHADEGVAGFGFNTISITTTVSLSCGFFTGQGKDQRTA